jgi:hypothetical protein
MYAGAIETGCFRLWLTLCLPDLKATISRNCSTTPTRITVLVAATFTFTVTVTTLHYRYAIVLTYDRNVPRTITCSTVVMTSALASALTTPASDYYCISSPLDYDNLHYYSSSEHCALKDLYI